ncbi:MAG: response regulator [Myxococcales bacterium]|nr:MAG: response regulator [Myxococcales bacterium]
MVHSSTILIVEDNAKTMKLCRDLLELRGHSILEATDGEEGINLARLHRPDLILMDIQLPVMDGQTAARLLKEKKETRNIPIVAFTAFAMKGDEERFLTGGFDGYVAKPIDTRRFGEQIEGFLKPKR